MKLLFLNPPKFFDTWPIPLDAARDFINPPSTAYPLLSRLVPPGIQARFFDGFNEPISMPRFLDLLREQDLILIKSINSRGAVGVELAIGLAHRVNPRAKVILGGPHATLYPEEWVKRGADAVFRHEAETQFAKLVETVANGGDLATVQGVTYAVDGEIRATENAPLLDDFDDSPPPDWSLCNLDLYSANVSTKSGRLKCASIETSRGCIYNCNFCVEPFFWRHRQRKKSAGRVLAELRDLEERGVGEAVICDDNFGIYAERDREIFEEQARRGAPVRMHASIRADSVLRDPELFRVMGRGGLARMLIGYESLTDEGLDFFNKGSAREHGVEQFREVFRIAREAGIFVYGNFIVHSGQSLLHDLKVLVGARQVCDSYGTTNWEPLMHTDLTDEARRQAVPLKTGFYNFVHLSHFTRDSLLRRTIHIIVAIGTRVSPLRWLRALLFRNAHWGYMRSQQRLLRKVFTAATPSRILDYLIFHSPWWTADEKERIVVRRNLARYGFAPQPDWAGSATGETAPPLFAGRRKLRFGAWRDKSAAGQEARR